jgi:hypothetical protein
MCHDYRNDSSRHPAVFQVGSVANINEYNPHADGWLLKTAGLGLFAASAVAGCCCEFGAHRNVRGLITAYSAGGGTYRVTLAASSLPAAITWKANQMSDRGDGTGFKIRLIGSSAGGGGKISEHAILSNTGGTVTVGTTTPVVYFSGVPSFTPQNGDSYEILSGSMLVIGGLVYGAANVDVKAMEVASGTVAAPAANLDNKPPAITGAPTDAQLMCLDELYVPYDRSPGQGLLGVITSTATAGGQVTSKINGNVTNVGNDGDANVTTNEFLNFQIRITEDTTHPENVGLRRKITAVAVGDGATVGPQYTFIAVLPYAPTVGVTKFVIENPNWWIYQTTGGVGAAFVNIFRETGYVAGGTTYTEWTSVARGNTAGVGTTLFPSYGCEQDNQIPVADAANRVFRYSQIQSFQGGGAVLDIIDIATTADTVVVTNTVLCDIKGATFTTGTSYAIDPWSNSGKYVYIGTAGTVMYRYNIFSRVMMSWTNIPIALGTLVVGQRMAVYPFIDGSTKLTRVLMLAIGTVGFFDIVVTGY